MQLQAWKEFSRQDHLELGQGVLSAEMRFPEGSSQARWCFWRARSRADGVSDLFSLEGFMSISSLLQSLSIKNARQLTTSRTTNNKNTAAFEHLLFAKHWSKHLIAHYLHLITAHVPSTQHRWGHTCARREAQQGKPPFSAHFSVLTALH